MTAVQLARSADLATRLRGDIRALLDAAFGGDFSDDDWDHTLGGWHVLAGDGGLVAHAALVERRIHVGGRPFRTGYVEGVATRPDRQGEGLGTLVMQHVDRLLRAEFELGALSTERHGFYERLGWERWLGPSFVRRGGELVRSAEEDDGIMVLRIGRSAMLDREAPISCESRSGDDW